MYKYIAKDVWIVMPAYNAEATLLQVYNKIPDILKENVILVDDCSQDRTVEIAENLGIKVIKHEKNLGYGGNQKTCYAAALGYGAEVVVMIHPDNQYDPRVALIMAELIQMGNCDIVLGNRIRTRHEALTSGMPKWRYFLNRSSTLVENLLLGQTIGDFHSGMRAYSSKSLRTIPYDRNSNDFGFDQQFLAQAVYFKFRIADIPIPARYEEVSSSISFRRSLRYAMVGFFSIFEYFLNKFTPVSTPRFK